jgi:glycosyltransferase involved in cell wall biosynthesis
METITVIIPTWNSSTTIKATLESAIHQTISLHEILICDDGSTDETKEIVKPFLAKKIRWLPGEHSGRPSIPRNRGIEESTGKWLAFLDSDDLWVPHKLETQLNLAKNNNCKGVCSNALSYNPHQNSYRNMMNQWPKSFVSFLDLLSGNQIICSSTMIHRSLLEQVKGFPEDPILIALEDYAFWLRVSVFTEFGFSSEPLLNYRDEPVKSIRNQGIQDYWQQRRYVLENWLTWSKTQTIPAEYSVMADERYKEALDNC